MAYETAQQVGILVMLAATLAYVWHLAGRGHWRAVLTDRFVYGVPWGSLVTILGVLAFYLFAQGGLEHWSDPVVLPFRSWSYTSLLGILTSGFAHASSGHITGNLLAAAVLSPLVEYAWGHYPPGSRAGGTDTTADYEFPPPSGGSEAPATTSAAGRVGASESGTTRGLLGRPWVRALVLFPAGVVVVSLATSVFAFGWSLGYSGTVFFFVGAALVAYPIATVIAMVALTGVNVVFSALLNPVLRVSAGGGGSGPPAWAGINVQAHLLGFLLGVAVALAVLRYRDEWPEAGRLALAVVLVALARSLWLLPTSDGNVFVQWRGVGVIFVFGLSFLVIATVGAEDRHLLGGVRLRGLLFGALVALTLVVALPSVATNLPDMSDDPVPGEDDAALAVQDYRVTYAENVSHGRLSTNESGVIVVSERRDIWTTSVDTNRLARRGTATVVLGGVGWRETVEANRTGWEVTGNGSVYTITLEHGDQQVRPFESDPLQATPRIDNRTVTLAPPETNRFRLRVGDGERLGSTVVPEKNQTSEAGGLTFSVEQRDDTETLFAERNGTRVAVAERE